MKIIGHRGAKGLAPENTLRAFEKALQHHVDEIELDVRVTKDGLTALVHDPFVKDQAGNSVEVDSHTFEELQHHKPELIKLDEAIAYIDRRVPMVIEIKPKVSVGPVIAIVSQFLSQGWEPTDFRVASFSQKILRDFHAAVPEVTIVVNESWSGVRASYRARQLGTRRIAMRSWWLWSGFLASVKHSGYEISPYTINNPAKARKWQKYLYGVVTDYPDLFEKPKSYT